MKNGADGNGDGEEDRKMEQEPVKGGERDMRQNVREKEQIPGGLGQRTQILGGLQWRKQTIGELWRKKTQSGIPSGRPRRSIRESLSRKLLSCLERHTPEFLSCIALQVLADATAEAFGRNKARLSRRSRARALAQYAAFTRMCMAAEAAERKRSRGDDRLYRRAYALGRRIRRITGFTDLEELKRLVFYLYRIIGIRMSGRLPGEITVSSCIFSGMYTPAQCARMSQMDAGIIAGICGNGRLEFTERLTEGCGRCRARFTARRDHG